MFCNKCGNKIEDGSTFCSRCGARVEPPIYPSSVPVNGQPSETAASAATAAPDTSAAPDTASAANAVQMSESIPADGENAAQPAPAAESAVPRPIETAKTGWSSEVPIGENPPKAEKAEAPAKAAKYYTGVHLALCLITTGIMAMAAGVFAALYFMG